MSFSDSRNGGAWSSESDEYSSDSSDWSSERDDERVVLISKKQKKYMRFKQLLRSAVIHFNTNEYIKFKHDLKQINHAIKINNWAQTDFKMPKFYVKHMMLIYDKISLLNPANISIKEEKMALKLLQKNTDKQIYHIKQMKLFRAQPIFWKDANSDIDISDTDICNMKMSTTERQLLTFGYIQHVERHLIDIIIPQSIINLCFQYYCPDDFEYLWNDINDEQDEECGCNQNNEDIVEYDSKMYQFGSAIFTQKELEKMHQRCFWIKQPKYTQIKIKHDRIY